MVATNGGAIAHGEIDERIGGMDLRIAADGDDPMLYLLRADLHREHRNWASATSDIQSARALAPDNLNVEFYRALLLRDIGELAEAERALIRYVERAPAWSGPKVPLHKVLQVLAAMLIDQGRSCEAALKLDHAVAAAERPGPQLYLSRARQFVRCDPPDYDMAIRGLDEGIDRLGPGATVLEQHAIDLELARGSVDRALERIDAQITRAPERPSIWIRRAELLEKAGRPAEALAAYRQAQDAINTMPERARATRGARALARQAQAGIGRVE